MAKGKSQQQQQPQGQQKKNSQQSSARKVRDNPSRGCCGCIFNLICKLVLFTALLSAVYVATFTGYTYHSKQRVPTIDEFKAYTTESYHVVSKHAIGYYKVAEKHTKVYYAHFEKNHLPVIQQYTKEYTKYAAVKGAEFKVIALKYFAIAQKRAEEYYHLALDKIAEYQSGKSAGEAPPAPKKQQATTAAPPKVTTPKPTQAPKPSPTPAPTTTPKPTQAPTQAPTTTNTTTTPKPTAKATAAPKPAEKKAATGGASKEKKEL